jgi:ABC-2 type transport system permease protein
VSAFAAEVGKVPAFLRRDLLFALSYRAGFISDSLGLFVQALLFAYVGRLVDPSVLPTYGGTHTSYLGFAVVGIALGTFMQIGLARVATAMRQEQMLGTLESLLMTPTSPATIQIGSVVYDLIYVPLRTALFIAIVALAFGVDIAAGGIAPAAVIMLCLVPAVWGLGLVAAASMLTFRRGDGVVGLGTALLTLASGAYFPLDLLPDWLARIAAANPLAIAIEAMREAVLGGSGWGKAAPAIALLLPMAACTLAAGGYAFRLALARERRNGTLGLY